MTPTSRPRKPKSLKIQKEWKLYVTDGRGQRWIAKNDEKPDGIIKRLDYKSVWASFAGWHFNLGQTKRIHKWLGQFIAWAESQGKGR